MSLHGNRAKAWRNFNRLCAEMTKLGILEPQGKDRLHITQEFQEKAIRLFEHPINVEAWEAFQKDPKHFFDTCVFATIVGYYGTIPPKKLEPRWEIVHGLLEVNELELFRKQNR